MKKYSLNAFLIAAFGLFAGSFFDINAQTVSGSIGNGAVLRGGSAKGSIILNIPGGLHVNSSKPNSEYAIPTNIRLIGTGVQTVGIKYPSGKNRKFQFSDESINVYEGRVAIPFTISVPKNFKGNTLRIRARVRYQACTEEVCYPPKSKDITLTARVL